MILRDLKLKTQYRSDEDDLLRDFYYPCLRRSKSYCRAVGYFTSSSLFHVASGLVGLIKRGGKMKLIASPLFTKEDLENIQSGYSMREIVSQAVSREIDNLTDQDILARVSNLAWLISHDLLDIKVAVISDTSVRGIYHEKLGVFQDDDDCVAFSGSPNETEGGLVSNFECIDVFTSWDDPDRVKLKIKSFENLWRNKTTRLQIFEFPEAARRKLLRYASKSLPIIEVGLRPDSYSWYDDAGYFPYIYQQEAIDAWYTEKCVGLLELATGTGKTYIALRAIAQLVDEGYSFIVLVPRKLLAQQWEKQIKKHYPRALTLVCTSDHEWLKDADKFLSISLERMRKPCDLEPVFIISTFHTASKDAFLDMLNPYISEGKYGVIMDEVHWSGAKTFSRVFEMDAPIRLGLSATPERGFDEEGNKRIDSYFGEKSTYTFSLKQAIKGGFLTRYNYEIREVYLTSQEYYEYKELSKDIAKHFAKSKLDDNYENPILSALLAKRANILKSAVAKSEFLDWVHKTHKPQQCLVYCTNIAHLKSVASYLSQLGVLVGQYHSKMSEEHKKRNLKLFSAGDLDYLVSVKCLDEGIDIPDCQSAVILSSSTTDREFIQRRGRVLRRVEGKEMAFLYDPIVLPPGDSNELLYDTSAKKILEKELRRIAEFAGSSENSEKVERYVTVLKARYGLI